MEYRPLGRSDIRVSAICLGSMNWGSRNSEAEGFAQMDMAFDRGVNFVDSAEMYAVPPSPATFGRSEEILGAWMKARGNRSRVVVATKVAGPDARLAHIRGGPRLNARHIGQAVEASLKRLQTDYIDLYQLHWPERQTNTFGALGYRHGDDGDAVPLEETLEALAEQVAAGRLRQIGVSNETPWGTMRLLHLAATRGLPRIVSNQNPYSLLNRSFEAGCAEIAMREHVGLLAYAPMAAGALSGKYLGGARPAGARMTLHPENRRYLGPPNAEAATRAYVELARAHGLSPAALALAWCHRQPFMTSAIVGATTLAQLEEDLASMKIPLGDDLLAAIEDVHARYTYPCP